MMPRKKRKVLIITSVIMFLLAIIGVLIYLYYTTDMFKSNDVLFYKYLSNGFEIVEDFEKLKFSNEANQLLNKKQEETLRYKYTSNIEGTIKYTR